MIASLKQTTVFEKHSRLSRLTKACWQLFKFRICNFRIIVCCSLVFKNRINGARRASVFKSFQYWSRRALICALCEFEPRDVHWRHFFSISEAKEISENKFSRSRRLFKKSIIIKDLKEVILINFQAFATVLRLKVAFRKYWKIFKKFKRLNLTFSCLTTLFMTLSWWCLYI